MSKARKYVNVQTIKTEGTRRPERKTPNIEQSQENEQNEWVVEFDGFQFLV